MAATTKAKNPESKTSTGFKYNIDAAEIADDMELLEGFLALDAGDMTALPRCMALLLGEDQKAALYDHCRDKKTGRVSAKQVMAELKEIIEGANQNIKNC